MLLEKLSKKIECQECSVGQYTEWEKNSEQWIQCCTKIKYK